CKRQLQRLNKYGRCKPQGCSAPGHHRPFLGCDLLNVALDKASQPRFGFARKSSGEDHDGSERTGFTIDCRISPIVVTPDLRSSKRDEQAENNRQWRKESGRDRLKCTRSLAFREDGDEPLDCCR